MIIFLLIIVLSLLVNSTHLHAEWEYQLPQDWIEFHNLYDVAPLNGNKAWVVGEQGFALYYDGISWNKHVTGQGKIEMLLTKSN